MLELKEELRQSAHYSRRMPRTLESEEISNPREILLVLSSGPNTSVFNVKREFFFRDSRSLPLLTNSNRQLTKIKVRLSALLISHFIASQLLKLLAKYKPESH